MNVDTGELMRLVNGKKAPEGFTELFGEEAAQADLILGDSDSVFLPEDHPFRQQIANKLASASRPSPKAKRKAAKSSRRVNRK